MVQLVFDGSSMVLRYIPEFENDIELMSFRSRVIGRGISPLLKYSTSLLTIVNNELPPHLPAVRQVSLVGMT
jgi:hypothetical protein